MTDKPSGSFVLWENTLCNPLADPRSMAHSAWHDGYASGVKAEREECAKVCDDWPNGRDDVDSIAAIRSRYGMTEVTPAQVIHSDAAAQQLHAIDLLKLCHAYLRGAEINDSSGSKQINPDQLARQINLYLNDQSTQEQAHDQDQRDPASPTDQAPA